MTLNEQAEQLEREIDRLEAALRKKKQEYETILKEISALRDKAMR